MSASGIIESTKISGILRFTFRSFAAGFPRRYANAMCPTANEVFSPLKSQTFTRRVIKLIGLKSEALFSVKSIDYSAKVRKVKNALEQ
jgi:hypothetical protein